MSRRGRGEGTVYQRTNKKGWVAMLTLPDGRRKAFYARTRREVDAKLQEARRQIGSGLGLVDDRQTVATFLGSWLRTVQVERSANTYRTYEILTRRHILPALGNVKLSRLTAQQIQALYADKLAEGLARATVSLIGAILHRALDQAEEWDLLTRNPADRARRIRPERKDMRALDADQARALLAGMSEHRLHALFTLALMTAARQGELLGLRWRNVDWDNRLMQIGGTLNRQQQIVTPTKTAGSRRSIELVEPALAALRQHRAAQVRERVAAPAWQDNDLIFCRQNGKPLDGGHVTGGILQPALVRLELPRVTFHSLRHSAATLLMASGVHPAVVARILGHSSAKITMDVYSHVSPAHTREALEGLARLLSG